MPSALLPRVVRLNGVEPGVTSPAHLQRVVITVEIVCSHVQIAGNPAVADTDLGWRFPDWLRRTSPRVVPG